MNKRKQGGLYEKLAANYLEEQGLNIIDMNYNCRLGEIDIIAKDGATLVFVEVKYRKNMSMGHPIEAVDSRKQMRIRKIAQVYMTFHNIMENVNCRFDVVGILDNQIIWIKDAF